MDIGQSGIKSIKTSNALFSKNQMMIGCANSGSLDCEIIKPDFVIPSMAKINLYARALATNGNYSSWIPKGVYFIDTRQYGTNGGQPTLKIKAYDAMMRAEDDYPSTSHTWPATLNVVVSDIVGAMGVQLDFRCFRMRI